MLREEANKMAQKDFNSMLHNRKDMPKTVWVTDEKSIARYGGSRMYFAPPIDYDRVMRCIPYGKVATVGQIRGWLAKQNGADFADPMTAGIFISIAAWASEQRDSDFTPWWRTLKSGGELNAKYPGGIEKQKALLEAEGHIIELRGRSNCRYFVSDYQSALVSDDAFIPKDGEAL